jgi:hypothetical protein
LNSFSFALVRYDIYWVSFFENKKFSQVARALNTK